MVQKRPLGEEETFEVSNKHLRQAKLESRSDPIFPEIAYQKSNISDIGEDRFIDADANEKLGHVVGMEQLGAKAFDSNVNGSHSMSSWGTSSTSEEDSGTDEPLHVPLLPEYYNPERPIRTLAHWEDIYTLLLEHPPRKHVPIGPNHQADVPVWDSEVTENAANHVCSSEVAADGYEKALMGTCIVPMPDLESSSYDGEMVGKGRTDCGCNDKGSVRCVRQHVDEAREKLRKYIGHERFVELGFCDVGELVAEKWSEEEEQLFDKVVYSNPVSLGRNFWNSLSVVFPYRTKKEIVSYYFNVFMLRKRAEQNRCESMSIDSDNDEWQGSDDSGNSEAGMSDEDEYSVVESPIYGDDFSYHQSQENGLHAFDENVADETCDDDKNVNHGTGAEMTNVPEPFSGKLFNIYASHPASEVQGKTSYDEQGEQEVQYDSCTSSEKGAGLLDSHLNNENGDHWPGSFNGLTSDGDHEFVLEHCDPKVWDAAYPTCQRNKFDFLPTCSMIEEVFGDESWNYKPRDGKSMS
ncbi:hypothetical protein SLE2022_291410 [Rubroshorea leprosula]